MIDRASIMAWAEHAPWTDPAMVEQDLWGLQHQSSTSPRKITNASVAGSTRFLATFSETTDPFQHLTETVKSEECLKSYEG